MEKLNKISGAIIGMIIGDILATPLKSLSENEKQVFMPISNLVEPFNLDEEIEAHPNDYEHLKNLQKKVENYTPSGFYSFYSQYALLVLDSLSHFSAFDIEDISQRLVKYSYPRDKFSPLGIYRGYTNEFYESLKNISNGLPLRICGNAHNIGDSAIQSIPMTLFYKNNTKSIKESCIDLTLLTHKTVYDCSAATSISYTVGRAAVTSFFKVDEELDAIIKIAKETEEHCFKRFGSVLDLNPKYLHVFSEMLSTLYDLKNQSLENGIATIKEKNSHNGLKENSSVVNSLVALLIFIKYIGNFEQGIKSCFEQKNIKTEIIAPIVGALSGSLLGVEKIPTKWKKLYPNEDYLTPIIENLFKEENKVPTKNFYINELETCNAEYTIKLQQLNKIEKYISKITN